MIDSIMPIISINARLREAGYKNTQNETFGDFILVWVNN